MFSSQSIRWDWLKAVYILTMVVAGGLGLGIIIAPSTATFLLGVSCDVAQYGIIGSVYFAFGVLSILGLRYPLRFVPVLLLQLVYKLAWLIGIALPLFLQGRLPESEAPTVIIFVITVALDLVAIPFRYLFAKQAAPDSLLGEAVKSR